MPKFPPCHKDKCVELGTPASICSPSRSQLHICVVVVGLNPWISYSFGNRLTRNRGSARLKVRIAYNVWKKGLCEFRIQYGMCRF